MWRVKLEGASPLGTHTMWLYPLYKRPEWFIGPLSYFCPAETSWIFFFFFLFECLLYSWEKNKARCCSLTCSGNEKGCGKTGCTTPAIFECTTLCKAFLSLSTSGLTDNSHVKQPWGGQAAGVAASPPLEVAASICVWWEKHSASFRLPRLQ